MRGLIATPAQNFAETGRRETRLGRQKGAGVDPLEYISTVVKISI